MTAVGQHLEVVVGDDGAVRVPAREVARLGARPGERLHLVREGGFSRGWPGGCSTSGYLREVVAVAVSAHDVAAVLRERLPGLPATKLRTLLYYCQGHHVAVFGRPLFSERVEAWDTGPVVADLWRGEKYGTSAAGAAGLDVGQLNTIGYVLSRYGALTGRDLDLLSHAEQPWQLADAGRGGGNRAVVTTASMRSYFATAGAPGDDDVPPLDSAEVAEMLRDAAGRRVRPARPDSADGIRAWLATSA